MPLEIIGAGFGRTGTLSLKRALETLGYAPCYHMEEVFKDPRRVGDWTQAAGSPAPDWEGLFRGYLATVDWPAATYWRELVVAYPDARIILSLRDPDAWFDSTQKTIFKRQELAPRPDDFLEMVDLVVFSLFDGRIDDRAHCIDVYERHNRAVIESVPPDRLLVFEAGQGWDPLCSFLGCVAPVEPFPHVNTSEDFQKRLDEPNGLGAASISNTNN